MRTSNKGGPKKDVLKQHAIDQKVLHNLTNRRIAARGTLELVAELIVCNRKVESTARAKVRELEQPSGSLPVGRLEAHGEALQTARRFASINRMAAKVLQNLNKQARSEVMEADTVLRKYLMDVKYADLIVSDPAPIEGDDPAVVLVGRPANCRR